MISYGSTDFENFKRSNISRSEFSFYAEPLNISGRRYLEIYEITNYIGFAWMIVYFYIIILKF
jgi:hypothetical protein